MNTYHPFSLTTPSALMIEDWNCVNQLNTKVIAGFTTKNGGVSNPPYESLNTGLHVRDEAHDVVTNRGVIASLCGTDLDSWVFADQTHENRVRRVTAGDKGKGARDYSSAFRGTDGLYTKDANLFLALCFADCVPLYFYDPVKSIIGAAHAGWKGTVKQIGRIMTERWVNEEGSRLTDIQAVIGPSISAGSYTVDDRVINEVRALPFTAESAICETEKGQYQLDLKEVNRLLLIHCGIPEENISVSGLCTERERELFFSHRRDKGKTGRMMSFIGMKEA
ncbi:MULTISPECIES: peptidoglycan editing factor PgeF [Bacillus]|uniref:peptidoglycan editing factor PgeF n=1 Tax=Bacillus TaxID=1386 RepID=UPI0007110D4D|nr:MULTISPECIES: peptidoglycan editing factor PgeF [Bacillus amyloliquefaciens group]APH50234.1 laccase [Bacillus amyloliquefaciens]MDN4140220.1 peptidoglycan editing factor PgeF [Bacillus velezensis]WFQ88785.1 peptidoglycan editing factor PgeF [Bacillus velezensis]